MIDLFIPRLIEPKGGRIVTNNGIDKSPVDQAARRKWQREREEANRKRKISSLQSRMRDAAMRIQRYQQDCEERVSKEQYKIDFWKQELAELEQ